MVDNSHQHNFIKEGNYYVCSCGKKLLAFEEKDGLRIGMRSNGMKYTKKANTNRFLFPKEWAKLDSKMKPKVKHTAYCLLFSGCRINEIKQCNLVEDFVYDKEGRSRLVIRHTKVKARKGEFRTGRVRDIPISKKFAKYLALYLENHPDGNLNLLTNAGFNTSFKKTAKLTGIKNPEDLSAHTLRKTLEVWLMSLGLDSLPLTAHLGHSISTAASNYVSPDILSWEDKKMIRYIIDNLYVDMCKL
jgi:integrase